MSRTVSHQLNGSSYIQQHVFSSGRTCTKYNRSSLPSVLCYLHSEEDIQVHCTFTRYVLYYELMCFQNTQILLFQISLQERKIRKLHHNWKHAEKCQTGDPPTKPNFRASKRCNLWNLRIPEVCWEKAWDILYLKKLLWDTLRNLITVWFLHKHFLCLWIIDLFGDPQWTRFLRKCLYLRKSTRLLWFFLF